MVYKQLIEFKYICSICDLPSSVFLYGILETFLGVQRLLCKFAF